MVGKREREFTDEVKEKPPDFSNPLKEGSNKGQPLVEFEPRSRKRRTAIVSKSATHGQTILANNCGLVIGAFLDSTLKVADTPRLLFQLLFGLAVCLIDWLGGFSKVMKVAQLVRHSR